eukprot:7338652-Pyramimonas_sp.AAC.1
MLCWKSWGMMRSTRQYLLSLEEDRTARTEVEVKGSTTQRVKRARFEDGRGEGAPATTVMEVEGGITDMERRLEDLCSQVA